MEKQEEISAVTAGSTGVVASVVVMTKLKKTLWYEVPVHFQGTLHVGHWVLVPLRGRSVEGVVVETKAAALMANPPKALALIEEILSAPLVPNDLIALGRFIAEYYLTTLGEAFQLFRLVRHVHAVLLWRLTEEGEGVIHRLRDESVLRLVQVNEQERAALSLFQESGKRWVRDAWIKKQWKEPGEKSKNWAYRKVLERLEHSGFIEKKSHTPSVAHGKEKWIVPLERDEGWKTTLSTMKKRAPRQAALLDAIHEPGRLSEWVAKVQQAHTLLRSLLKKGLIKVEMRDRAEPQAQEIAARDLLALNSHQQAALERLVLALDGGEPVKATSPSKSFLLHGVTGAGKTEVYLRLIAAALQLGRSALVLVPEIALTPQLADRFRAQFGSLVGVLHSALGEKDRRRCWDGFAKGTVKIAVGARSALFAPLPNLGVVIVDEEHDPSFKQQEGVCYHARDLALVRAKAASAVVVLGSATPSCEAWRLAEVGKIELITLPNRATAHTLPQVEVVDLRQHPGVPSKGLISLPLRLALEQTLAAKEQALIFLNRRGYAAIVLCTACGTRMDCNSCAVALTWHRESQHLLCHYCGYTRKWVEICPTCQSASMSSMGFGTEKLVEELRGLFPGARIERLDRDTATPKMLEKTLLLMHQREVDILVGTQMIAKGHDFSGVTLVGAVWADAGMHWPDFRATERTFQVLTQVAGRAGRADRLGRVFIQTWLPTHPAIQFACRHDAVSFIAQELEVRKTHGYPPFRRMAALRFDGETLSSVQEMAESVGRELDAKIRLFKGEMDVLGPAAAPISRLKGRVRYQLFIRAESSQKLHGVLRDVLASPSLKKDPSVRMKIDMDPGTML